MWEATRSDPCPSGRSELQIGPGMISTGDQRKDYRGPVSHGGSGNNRHINQDVRQNNPQNCKAMMTSDKEFENADVIAQLHKDSNTGAGPPENAFSSGVSSSVPARSIDFQFDVRSENGIQLCVDLNSNPSDWIESMKNGVHICQCHDVHGNMFQEDLGHICSKQLISSSVEDSESGMNKGNFEDGCSQSRMETAAGARAGEPEVGGGPLKSCSDTVHGQVNMGEKQVIIPLTKESDRGKEVSCVKSSERDDKNAAVNVLSPLTKSRKCNFSGKSCVPKRSGTLENQELTAGNGVLKGFSLRQINGFLKPAPKFMVPPAFATVEMHASPFATLGQDVGLSSSGASTSTGLADKLQYEGEHCGLPQSLQFHGNRHQLPSVEAADASRYGTCSNKSRSRYELHIAEVSRKSRGQATEAQTRLATCRRECMPLSLCKRNGSPDVVHLTNNVEIDNSDFLRSPESGQGAVDVHSSMFGVEKDVLLSPGRNGVSLDLVVPEQNGAGHFVLTCSKELDSENCKRQPATCAGNVGMSNAGHGKERSEYLERDLMERSCVKLTNPEFNGELKRKRQFSSVEDQSNYVNSGSWILRTSEDSTGDIHASRKKSSRFSKK